MADIYNQYSETNMNEHGRAHAYYVIRAMRMRVSSICAHAHVARLRSTGDVRFRNKDGSTNPRWKSEKIPTTDTVNRLQLIHRRNTIRPLTPSTFRHCRRPGV